MHWLAGEVAVDPALHGGPGDLETGGDFADWSAVVNDEARDFQSVARGEGSIRVGHV